MEEYNILNSIKPRHFKTDYPYNLVDPAKILFTRNKIKLLVKQTDKKGGKEMSRFDNLDELDLGYLDPETPGSIVFYG
jgi:hypothetical protein